MKYLMILLMSAFFVYNSTVTAFADSPLFLPHLSSGTQARPGGASLEISIEEATILVCADENNEMIITRESDTIVDIACLPILSTAALTPAAASRTIPIDDSASLVCNDPKHRIRIANKSRHNIQIECLPDAATPTPPQPVGADGTWDLIFSDEFLGPDLDLAVWEPSWFAGNDISEPVNTLEAGCYHPSQVSLRDGLLNLHASTTTDASCRTKNGAPTPYISGLINTRNSFTFSYGYMEARIFLPGSNGEVWNWPAWWSDGTGRWPETGEIDVMEGLESHRACWHYHYADGSGTHRAPGGCANIDATGWHTYGALWEANTITFYYDGVQVGQISEGVIDAEHFLILNYGIRDDFGIHAPATMQVDYVRVWQP